MTESAKATPPSWENPYSPVVFSFPAPFSNLLYPPFFPSAPDGTGGTHTEGTPSHWHALPVAQSLSQPFRPQLKRRQVKIACKSCAKACKRCDESRPCQRCVKYGIGDTCIDGQRKGRLTGYKRGPYKRKKKEDVPGDCQLSAGSQPPSASTTPTPIHTASQYAPEGYYMNDSQCVKEGSGDVGVSGHEAEFGDDNSEKRDDDGVVYKWYNGAARRPSG